MDIAPATDTEVITRITATAATTPGTATAATTAATIRASISVSGPGDGRITTVRGHTRRTGTRMTPVRRRFRRLGPQDRVQAEERRSLRRRPLRGHRRSVRRDVRQPLARGRRPRDHDLPGGLPERPAAPLPEPGFDVPRQGCPGTARSWRANEPRPQAAAQQAWTEPQVQMSPQDRAPESQYPGAQPSIRVRSRRARRPTARRPFQIRR